ncbi:hypothetical protein TNIN_438651 [Trichonephila inaurata madagascariensis]|uniref:Uncharacterized protein n=1 Tax=Trichonephila inaurata madagascariensis TaxID=2747483 RepID=A0A8X7C211_9ARAC|nr:hypothetical protein TNIN_438651 [Trichonephila inaurata madagascariensis]
MVVDFTMDFEDRYDSHVGLGVQNTKIPTDPGLPSCRRSGALYNIFPSPLQPRCILFPAVIIECLLFLSVCLQYHVLFSLTSCSPVGPWVFCSTHLHDYTFSGLLEVSNALSCNFSWGLNLTCCIDLLLQPGDLVQHH